MAKHNFEEIIELLYQNTQAIQNLLGSDFVQNICGKLDELIEEFKVSSKGVVTQKDGMEGKDFRLLRDILSVYLKQLGVAGDKTEKFLIQIEKDLKEQYNLGVKIDKVDAAIYAAVKILEEIPKALEDKETGKKTSALDLTNMKKEGQDTLQPIIDNLSKYSIDDEDLEEALDDFSEKLFNFLTGQSSKDADVKEAKDKKNRRTFIDDLIDALAASKFIGGAVQDGAKLFGYLIASHLAKFGPVGRFLGAIAMAATTLIPKALWDIAKEIIKTIVTFSVAKAVLGGKGGATATLLEKILGTGTKARAVKGLTKGGPIVKGIAQFLKPVTNTKSNVLKSLKLPNLRKPILAISKSLRSVLKPLGAFGTLLGRVAAIGTIFTGITDFFKGLGLIKSKEKGRNTEGIKKMVGGILTTVGGIAMLFGPLGITLGTIVSLLGYIISHTKEIGEGFNWIIDKVKSFFRKKDKHSDSEGNKFKGGKKIASDIRNFVDQKKVKEIEKEISKSEASKKYYTDSTEILKINQEVLKSAPFKIEKGIDGKPNANFTYMQPKMMEFLERAGKIYQAKTGKQFTVTSALRDDKKQAELWARRHIFGDTSIDPTVVKPLRDTTITWKGKTVKVPGSYSKNPSAHMKGAAVDIAEWAQLIKIPEIQALMQALGIQWGGEFNDNMHFQLRNYKVLSAPQYVRKMQEEKAKKEEKGSEGEITISKKSTDSIKVEDTKKQEEKSEKDKEKETSKEEQLKEKIEAENKREREKNYAPLGGNEQRIDELPGIAYQPIKDLPGNSALLTAYNMSVKSTDFMRGLV